MNRECFLIATVESTILVLARRGQTFLGQTFHLVINKDYATPNEKTVRKINNIGSFLS
jgi:hypothetical protein